MPEGEILGACTARGPCRPLQGQVAAHGVRRVEGQLFAGDYRIASCPWCGNELPPLMLALPAWRRFLDLPVPPPPVSE